MVRLDVIREKIFTAHDLVEINKMVSESEAIFSNIEKVVNSMYESFGVIKWLCILNLTFILQHFVTFIFTSKLKRFYQFPTITHVTDSVLFASSLFIINWISGTL